MWVHAQVLGRCAQDIAACFFIAMSNLVSVFWTHMCGASIIAGRRALPTSYFLLNFSSQ